MNIEARDVTIDERHCTISNVLITSDLYSEPVMSMPAWFTESLVSSTLRSFGNRSFQLQGWRPQRRGTFIFATKPVCWLHLHSCLTKILNSLTHNTYPSSLQTGKWFVPLFLSKLNLLCYNSSIYQDWKKSWKRTLIFLYNPTTATHTSHFS